MDSEDWYERTVRTRDGRVLGVVVGVFAEGALAGRLRVHGDNALGRSPARPQHDIAVYAIPRSAVLGRHQDSLVLDAAPDQARARWLTHVLRAVHVEPP
jgi:hypothetical protein